MLLTYLLVLLTGVAVSFISTLFGLGGGILMVPVLTLILPFSHLDSIATSLATIVLVAAFNTYNFNKKGVVVWSIVPWIAVSSATFALVTAYVSTYIPENILILIFFLVLLWTALRTFLIKESELTIVNGKTNRLIPLGIGTLSGTISGLTGIGGGGITTPLTLVTKLVNNIQAAPTSNAVMIFTTAFASISFALASNPEAGKLTLGYIHFDYALLLFCGSLIFSRIGVRINQKVPLFWRKTILGIILVFICIRLFIMLIN
jgi:uncharacterized membrane protein YfcA